MFSRKLNKYLLLCCNVVQIYRFFMFSRWQKWSYYISKLQDLKDLQVGTCIRGGLCLSSSLILILSIWRKNKVEKSKINIFKDFSN